MFVGLFSSQSLGLGTPTPVEKCRASAREAAAKEDGKGAQGHAAKSFCKRQVETRSIFGTNVGVEFATTWHEV